MFDPPGRFCCCYVASLHPSPFVHGTLHRISGLARMTRSALHPADASLQIVGDTTHTHVCAAGRLGLGA